MRDESLVSILIPTFQRPKELRKALESVIAQTYTNLEILISNNDCENEETNALCREFEAKDKRIIYHVQPSNIGAVGNTAFLMNSANGNFTLMMNDDDWISDRYIELTLKTLQSDPKCTIVHGDYILYSQNYQPFLESAFENYVQENYEERMLAVACCRYLPFHSLWRTSLFKEHKLFDPKNEKIRIGEDWLMVLKMIFLGCMRTVSGATYHKCFHNHDVIYYADLLDTQCFDKDNPSAQKLLSMIDSIAYDSFYSDKLSRNERVRLIALLSSKMGPKRLLGVDHITGIKDCLSYLWRHPLAVFKKKATIILETKRTRNRK